MADPIHIWTVQMARWRKVKEAGIFFLDITAKSGILAFAPEFENVMRYKRGELTEEEYTQLYLERMVVSKQKYPMRWASLKNHPQMALACYCKPGVFCHRHLFAKLMTDHLAEQGIPVIHHGEFLNGTEPTSC
jgi:hypothetical protein